MDLQKDIKLLEGVQICSKNYYMSYEDLLDTFQLPDLPMRRLPQTLITVHESFAKYFQTLAA